MTSRLAGALVAMAALLGEELARLLENYSS